MRPEDFDVLVERCYTRIPKRFRDRLENVAITVEPEPTAQQLGNARVSSGSTLLGLYEGRPRTVRSVFDGFAMPDRITLFQGPIERSAAHSSEVEQMIFDTLWHEIAHYFGMDERQVRSAERARKLSRLRRALNRQT